jgi:hypothetical protein
MRCTCPNCAGVLLQDRNADGLNYCTNCGSLFVIPPTRPLPPWILGVLTVMIANWQLLCR